MLAQKLSIFTGRKFSEAEMLPYAHAMIDLADDDLRRAKLGLALSDAPQRGSRAKNTRPPGWQLTFPNR